MIAFSIDGTDYTSDEMQIFDFEETADILNGKNSGRLQNGEMYIEPLATFYNHSFTIHRRHSCSNERWDNLYDILSDPNNTHTVTVFHNQDYLTRDIYVSKVKRQLLEVTGRGNKWGDMTVELVPISPDWRA